MELDGATELAAAAAAETQLPAADGEAEDAATAAVPVAATALAPLGVNNAVGGGPSAVGQLTGAAAAPAMPPQAALLMSALASALSSLLMPTAGGAAPAAPAAPYLQQAAPLPLAQPLPAQGPTLGRHSLPGLSMLSPAGAGHGSLGGACGSGIASPSELGELQALLAGCELAVSQGLDPLALDGEGSGVLEALLPLVLGHTDELAALVVQAARACGRLVEGLHGSSSSSAPAVASASASTPSHAAAAADATAARVLSAATSTASSASHPGSASHHGAQERGGQGQDQPKLLLLLPSSAPPSAARADLPSHATPTTAAATAGSSGARPALTAPQQLEACLGVVNQLCGLAADGSRLRRGSAPFRAFADPVTEAAAPGYAAAIAQPMWLREVRRKLLAGDYGDAARGRLFSAAAVLADIDLIASNCEEYNEPTEGDGEQWHALAAALRQQARRLWAEAGLPLPPALSSSTRTAASAAADATMYAPATESEAQAHPGGLAEARGADDAAESAAVVVGGRRRRFAAASSQARTASLAATPAAGARGKTAGTTASGLPADGSAALLVTGKKRRQQSAPEPGAAEAAADSEAASVGPFSERALSFPAPRGPDVDDAAASEGEGDAAKGLAGLAHAHGVGADSVPVVSGPRHRKATAAAVVQHFEAAAAGRRADSGGKRGAVAAGAKALPAPARAGGSASARPSKRLRKEAPDPTVSKGDSLMPLSYAHNLGAL
jgi:hypothetical protein